MNKHTPGPWTVTGQSEGGRYITVKAGTGRTVARVPWSTAAEGEAGAATDAADATLIAAAPDLLDAAKECERVLSDLPSTLVKGTRTARAFEIVRAAIAKAEGKS